MKESVRAEQFLYLKQALQYVNGHAVSNKILYRKINFYTNNFKRDVMKWNIES